MTQAVQVPRIVELAPAVEEPEEPDVPVGAQELPGSFVDPPEEQLGRK